MAGKDTKIRDLRDTIKALKRGKTQQEFGPDFEVKLLKRLKDEFPTDDIQLTKGSRGEISKVNKY